MRRTDKFALLVALCACVGVGACADHAASTSTSTAAAAAPVPARAAVEVPAVAPASRMPTQEAADQATQADPQEATPAAARQVVIDYYAAIDARDYAAAYALWSDQGAASGQSFEHFSGGYSNTRSVKADVGKAGDEEGAAGSRFIEVPVQLKAMQRDGSECNYRGHFTLRAVMADGASEEQRRWHLASAEMQRLPD